MNKLLALLSGLLHGKIAYDSPGSGKGGWITMNGTPVKLDDKGDPVAGPSNVVKPEQKSTSGDKFGEAFTAYSGKPAEAIEHLLKEKRGHVPGAFSKEGLGDIDLPYGEGGKKGFGLAHIIERRNAEGKDGEAFVRSIPQIIKEGTVEYRREYKNRAYITHAGKEAVIRLDWDGSDRKWLVTAYHQEESKSSLSSDRRTDLNRTCVNRKTTPLNLESNKNISPSRSRVNPDLIAFDRASRRHCDANGFLHVSLCHISKEQVAGYYGSEIPGWQKAGLDPNRIYKGFRPGPELAKAAATFNGLPLLNEHMKDSAKDPQKDLRIGNLGTDAVFRAPYLDNSLIIQDAEAIEALNPSEPGKAAKRELSASYRYDPVFKSGVFNGQRYDFIMTNIRGNHVALVEEGRAGSDVVVSDENTIKPRGSTMDLKALLEQLLSALSGGKAPESPGTDTDADTPPADTPPASDNGSDEPTGDGDDFADRLAAHIAAMEDKDLAAKLAEAVKAVKTAGLSADKEPDSEDDKDKDGPPAMDGKKKRPAYKAGPAKLDKKTGNVVINMAMDAKAVAAAIRDGFKAQIEAARDVRPLIGDVDPLAFDSAAGIYGKALELIGKPSKLTDPKALKELCALACDAKRGKNPYPVVSSVLANDSKGDADPAFANLGNIRKA